MVYHSVTHIRGSNTSPMNRTTIREPDPVRFAKHVENLRVSTRFACDVWMSIRNNNDPYEPGGQTTEQLVRRWGPDVLDVLDILKSTGEIEMGWGPEQWVIVNELPVVSVEEEPDPYQYDPTDSVPSPPHAPPEGLELLATEHIPYALLRGVLDAIRMDHSEIGTSITTLKCMWQELIEPVYAERTREALEILTNEGHLFTTIDDNHWKAV